MWHELDDVLDACHRLARAGQPAADFYRELLATIAPAVLAEGACAWQAMSPAKLQLAAVTGKLAEAGQDDLRSRVETMITQATGTTGSAEPNAYLIAAPVMLSHWLGKTAGDKPTFDRRCGALALVLPKDLPPSTYRAVEEFLDEVVALAAEYHARQQLATSLDERDELHRLGDLSRAAGKSLDLAHVADTIVNEGRLLLGCDRVTLFVPRGRGARLLATSGLERVSRRSRTVRDLEALAAICLRRGEAIAYSDRSDDAPPELAERIAEYADASEVRSLVAVPMTLPTDEGQTATPVGLVLAEHFTNDAAQLRPHRVQELAAMVAPALHASRTLDAIPLAGLWRRVPKLAQASTLGKLLLAAAVAVGIVAALVLVDRPFRVRASGSVLPAERSQVFAPRDGIVDQLRVEHGSQVAKGDVLLVMRDPQLELDRSQLAGERATLTSQLAALQSTRSALTQREASPLERYHLSAEVATIEQQLKALDERDKLLAAAAESLTVRSPRAGRVLSWQVDDQLARRPVARGDALMQVADTSGAWEIELDVPDDQMGYVRQAIADDTLRIEYQLAASETQWYPARVVRIAEHVSETTDALGNTTATVRLVATPATDEVDAELLSAALRPGGTLRGRLVCGTRSLGFVLFHELTRQVTEWWEL